MKNKKDSIFQFGDIVKGKSYLVLDENRIVINARIMLIIGIAAFVNGFILRNFEVIPFLSGFLFLNFLIGIFVNPKFMPTFALAGLFINSKKAKYIGAIQKRFAFSLGAILTLLVTLLSFVVIATNGKAFGLVCILCIICIVLITLEGFFKICVGCIIYGYLIKTNRIKKPDEVPTCMGNNCKIK